MTIYQLPHRCWELQPPTDDERSPHYELDAPCWVVRCDGECEMVLDTEDEGYIFHHDSRADAERTAAGYHWASGDDGRVFCEEDAPADAVAVPSPAELEAAGQLVLPGVLP